MVVYICRCYSLSSTFSFRAVSTDPFSTSASLFLSCRWVHQYHFCRFQSVQSFAMKTVYTEKPHAVVSLYGTDVSVLYIPRNGISGSKATLQFLILISQWSCLLRVRACFLRACSGQCVFRLGHLCLFATGKEVMLVYISLLSDVEHLCIYFSTICISCAMSVYAFHFRLFLMFIFQLRTFVVIHQGDLACWLSPSMFEISQKGIL